MTGDILPGLRLDKWLWATRFYKTRSLAAAQCASGRIRLSGRVIDKPHVLVRPGDVLTFPWNEEIKVVRVLGLPTRRGPAAEARGFYEELV